jgi:citrate lyase alpha subunit
MWPIFLGGNMSGMAFGNFNGIDGSIRSGSGNFEVSRIEAGKYLILINEDTIVWPSVAANVISGEYDANVIIEDIRISQIQLITVLVDGGSTVASDISYISFIAMWP